MNADSTLIEHLEQLEKNLTQDLSALKLAITTLKGREEDTSAPEEEEEEHIIDFAGVDDLLEYYELPRDKAFIADVIKSCKRVGMDWDGLNDLLFRVIKINDKNGLRDIKKYIFGSINNYKKA